MTTRWVHDPDSPSGIREITAATAAIKGRPISIEEVKQRQGEYLREIAPIITIMTNALTLGSSPRFIVRQGDEGLSSEPAELMWTPEWKAIYDQAAEFLKQIKRQYEPISGPVMPTLRKPLYWRVCCDSGCTQDEIRREMSKHPDNFFHANNRTVESADRITRFITPRVLIEDPSKAYGVELAGWGQCDIARIPFAIRELLNSRVRLPRG